MLILSKNTKRFSLLKFTLLLLVFVQVSTGCVPKPSGEPDKKLPQGEPDQEDQPNPAKEDRLFNLKSKTELIQQINDEFNQALFIRKIARYEDEIKYVIEERINIRQGKSKEDEIKPYWVSASVVRKDLKVPLYDSAAKTGLVISNKAKLGLFSPADAAVPTKVKKSAVNLNPAVSLFTKRLFPLAYEAYAGNINSMQDVKALLANMVNGVIPTPKLQTFNRLRAVGDPHYNEAIIYYDIENILGIWADSADESQALAFHQAIKEKYEADLPIVTYKLRKLDPTQHLYDVDNFAIEFAIR